MNLARAADIIEQGIERRLHIGAPLYGSRDGHDAPLRTWGHAGYVCSVGFLDPANRVVVAIVFNGMTEAGPALHERRERDTIDAALGI